RSSLQGRQRQRRPLRRRQSRNGTEVTEGTHMKFRKNPTLRALMTSAAVALALHLGPSEAADEPRPAPPATTEAAPSPAATNSPVAETNPPPAPVTTSSVPVRTRFLPLGVGKSVVVDLPRDVKDVLVADPKIANAVIRSSQRAYII